MKHYDPKAPRVPYALPASHKGYSAYSREIYTGGELQYRGKTTPVTTEETDPCEPQSQPSR